MTLKRLTLDDEILFIIVRRPDECLHDYLIRTQREMAGKIRLLAAQRDAWITALHEEHIRSRRQLLLLALAEAVGAVAGYGVLARHEGAAALPAIVVGALLGLAALATAIAALCANPVIAVPTRHPDSSARRP
jgi:hypothetical protein